MVPHFSDISHKAIATTRHGLDVAWFLGVVDQHLPQDGDVIGQVLFFNHALSPHLLHESVFLDYVTVVSYQSEQHAEGFWRNRDFIPIPPQLPFGNVEPERAELIKADAILTHKCR